MTRQYLALILASTTSLCGSAAWAQTSAANADGAVSEGTSSEIIVTAQKRSERLSDVPLSITAVTGDQLAKAGVNNPADLEKLVPGFTYQPSTFGTPVFTIRGIGFFDNAVVVAPAVTVYVDQVPLPYLAMTQAASLDLERVEVLKGPQGTLFGQNATGGAINYIAAKPTQTAQFGADLSYGRFNAIEAQGFVSGPVTDTLSARLTIRTEQRDDWQQSLTRNDSLGKRDFTTGRLLFDWRPNDQMKLGLSVTGWVDKSDTMAAQYVGYSAASPNYTDQESAIRANRPAPDKARAADWDPNTSLRRDDNFYQVAANGEFQLSDALTLTSITAYSHLKQDAPTDADGVPQNNFRLTVRAKIDAFSQELRLSGQMDRVNWMLGANYGNDRTKEDRAVSFTGSNSGIGPFRFRDFNVRNHQKIENKSVFASVDFKLTDSLTAQGSARYNHESRKFQGCLYDPGDGVIATAFGFLSSVLTGQAVTIPPGSCVTFGDGVIGQPGVPVDLVRKRLVEDNVSWRAGLSWKPASDSLLYANVTRGYKAGSFPTVPGLVPAQFDPVTQESITAYEAGFKTTLIDRTLQVTGAAFYYDYQNKQIAGYVATAFGNVPGLVSVPKSSVRGGELNVNWRPTRGLTINSGATYIKSRVESSFLTNDPLSNVVDIKGEDFPSTPHWQVVLNAEYEAPLNDKLNGFIGGNAHYRSAAVAAFGGLPEFRLPGYTVVDLHAGVETADQRWRAQVWGRNVFDKFYLVHVSHVTDSIARVAGMPATYGVSVSYRY